MKHTPGPWVVCPTVGLQFPVASVAMEGLKLNVAHVAGIRNGEGAANARIIAAAPDLLAALESALPALIRLGDFVGNVDLGGASNQGRIDRCALILQARAAIAKATGE